MTAKSSSTYPPRIKYAQALWSVILLSSISYIPLGTVIFSFIWDWRLGVTAVAIMMLLAGMLQFKRNVYNPWRAQQRSLWSARMRTAMDIIRAHQNEGDPQTSPSSDTLATIPLQTLPAKGRRNVQEAA